MHGNAAQSPDELWLPVPEFEGFYEASNFGRVRSLDRVVQTSRKLDGSYGSRTYGGRELLGTATGWSGDRVNLHKEGRSQTFAIARIVAITFLGPCPPNHHVRHRDGDRLNDHVSNVYFRRNYEVDAELSLLQTMAIRFLHSHPRRNSARDIAGAMGLYKHEVRRALNGETYPDSPLQPKLAELSAAYDAEPSPPSLLPYLDSSPLNLT
tara:strand:- start:494 stop:1120 length:627 start_codon:yes stop_codon:yes gene_type:complete